MAKLLILGQGKTGSTVAEIARERGHSVRTLASRDNEQARALTADLIATIDVVIDFTTPEAVLINLRALLPLGAKVVVGTTGWYAHLPEMTELAERHGASLLHGTNFSLGVQAFFRAARELARALPDYELSIEETHHVTKKDAPSGTALKLQRVVEDASSQEAPITSHREGDAAGLHVLRFKNEDETLMLQHESRSRRAFAEGAVRAAEWLAVQEHIGIRDFPEVSGIITTEEL